jgi:Flp pilus assembly pilin Flp
MQTRLTSLLRVAGERGQTMVEYSIVAALIAVVAMAAVQALGVGVTNVFNDIVGAITSI